MLITPDITVLITPVYFYSPVGCDVSPGWGTEGRVQSDGRQLYHGVEEGT